MRWREGDSNIDWLQGCPKTPCTRKVVKKPRTDLYGVSARNKIWWLLHKENGDWGNQTQVTEHFQG